jgi:hypothetical protein
MILDKVAALYLDPVMILLLPEIRLERPCPLVELFRVTNAPIQAEYQRASFSIPNFNEVIKHAET